MRIQFEKEEDKPSHDKKKSMPNKRVIKRKGRYGKNLIFDGKYVSREDYWEMKIKDHVKLNEDMFVNMRFNPNDNQKILILMKVWGVKTPTDLSKVLIEQAYGLLQTKKIIEKRANENMVSPK